VQVSQIVRTTEWVITVIFIMTTLSCRTALRRHSCSRHWATGTTPLRAVKPWLGIKLSLQHKHGLAITSTPGFEPTWVFNAKTGAFLGVIGFLQGFST